MAWRYDSFTLTNRRNTMSLSKLFYQIENRIVQALVSEILVKGFTISVDNGEEDFEIEQSHDEKAILNACALTDEDTIYFFDANGKNLGCVFIVYGEAETCITDYSDNPITNEIIDRALKIAGVED